MAVPRAAGELSRTPDTPKWERGKSGSRRKASLFPQPEVLDLTEEAELIEEIDPAMVRPIFDLTAPSDRIDLESIVVELSRNPLPPIPSIPYVRPPAPRPTWSAALAMAGTAMMLGMVGALVVFSTAHRERIGMMPLKGPAVLPALPAEIAPFVPVPRTDAVEVAPQSNERADALDSIRPAALETNLASTAGSNAFVEAPREESAAEVAVTPPIDDGLPATASRAEVEGTLRRTAIFVRRCAPGAGVAILAVTFGSNGRATDASVDATLATEGQMRCMRNAALAAHVSPFRASSVNVRYPVEL